MSHILLLPVTGLRRGLRTGRLLPGMLLFASAGALLLSGCGVNPAQLTSTGTTIGSSSGSPGGTKEMITGRVKGGNPPVTGATITMYAASTSGYGAASTVVGSTTTDSSGNFTLSTDTCSAGQQLYIVGSGGNPGLGGNPTSNLNSNLVLMAALGECNAVKAGTPAFVDINEVTTVASAFALAQFMTDATHVGGNDPTSLAHAFATVSNLVDIPSGQALAVTPAYCTSAPCVTATGTNTTPYYKTSIVPQGRINAMANALAACVNTQSSISSLSTQCNQLFTATTITTVSPVVSLASGTTVTPQNTLQAVLNIAHCPGDKTVTPCGVDVQSGSGIYSLVTANNFFQPTLTASTAGTTTDLSLALIFQGGGLGGGQGTKQPEATGLAIDQNGNVWVPTMSTTGGSLAVFNSLGAPLTPSGTSNTALGGYRTGVFNPQSIAIDLDGNAWIGNSPEDGNHGVGDHGSLSQVQLSGSSTFSTLLSGLSDGNLLTPAPWGLAVDGGGNVWLSSNPGGASNVGCSGNTFGGSILEFDSGTGSVLNTGSPDGYLTYSDNSTCPGPIAFDQNGRLWTSTSTTYTGTSQSVGLLQLDPASGNIVGPTSTDYGTYGYISSMQYLASSTYCANNNEPFPVGWGMAIDGQNNAWFPSDGSPSCMAMVPDLTQAGADDITNGTWGAVLESASAPFTVPNSAVIVDGQGNAWGTYENSLLAFNRTNATGYATASSTAMLSPASGYQASDPSVNSGGRTGSVKALGGGYNLDGSDLTSTFNAGDGFMSLGVDGAGNLWVAGAAVKTVAGTGADQGSELTEFIGIAAPLQTPLSLSLANGKLGARP